jgi:hypothetical protein
MEEKIEKIDKQAERYTYYLFKSKNKPVLTAKSKHWLRPKYNKHRKNKYLKIWKQNK